MRANSSEEISKQGLIRRGRRGVDAKRGGRERERASHVISSAVYSIHLAIMSHAPAVNNISAVKNRGGEERGGHTRDF